jgi:hypothetical protein
LLTLDVNCADYDGDEWPWYFFSTETTGSGKDLNGDPVIPVTVGGYSRMDPATESATQTAYSGLGQAVVRVIFAYIATDPISATIECSADTADTDIIDPNYRMIARLYEPNGALVEEFFDVNYSEESQTVTLPATVCPKILWVGAAAQPTGVEIHPPAEALIIVTLN